jgi:hypothetical protein
MENRFESVPEYIRTLSENNRANNPEMLIYDYPNLWLFLENKGKELYGPEFHFYEEDAPLIAKLLIWCSRDRFQADLNGISLHKGILLTGPVGCGKTALMSLIRHILHTRYRHRIYSCRQLAFRFSEEGFPVINHYSRYSFFPATDIPVTFCFDDLGLESDMRYYGDQCNTMAEVLLSRYEYFITHHMITHLTTNLNSSEIEARYGKRIRSRMKEMFNLISFSKGAEDKRK